MLDRRQLLLSLAATATAPSWRSLLPPLDVADSHASLHNLDGSVDWNAVRDLFPLRRDWTHLAAFLFVSHPRPVAQAIDEFRKKIDSDHAWIEQAVLTESEGRPDHTVKQSLADYIGGKPYEICLTGNTTTALAMAYHGLRIRNDQEIVTTEHDHYSHHESIRYAAARSGASVRFLALYDKPAQASADEIVNRIARAITPRTRAVGVTWVHSSTGVKLPITAIADVVARANSGRADADRCLLIVDGVHGFANQDVDVATLGADFFAAGTHKWLMAPRGTGFLWGRQGNWKVVRATIPSFDPDGQATWNSWMDRHDPPVGWAAFVSPGGFIAYEHMLAIPAAVALHRSIGRAQIASRIAELNNAFRRELVKVPGVTMHTPLDPALSGGLTCYEVAGMKAEQVTAALAAQKIRTVNSPYKVSYARVSAGVMNFPEDLDTALRAIRALKA